MRNSDHDHRARVTAATAISIRLRRVSGALSPDDSEAALRALGLARARVDQLVGAGIR